MSFDMEMDDYHEDLQLRGKIMKCLVTGGAGFVGTNLIKRLVKDKHNVWSLDNYTTGHIENQQDGCEYITGDIRDYKHWGKFDIIFHMAALPRIGPSFKNPKDVFDTNVLGTQNLLEYARSYNTPVIYAGSSSYHGGKYKNPYTFTKWQGEELCKMYGNVFSVSSSICRFYNVYGDYMINEGAYRTVLPILLKQYKEKVPFTITGDGEQRRDFIFVDDTINVKLWFLKNSNVSGIYNVGTGISRAFNDIANAVIKYFNHGKINYIDFPNNLESQYQAYTQADMTNLRKSGYLDNFTTLESGVKKYLDWLSNNS